MCDPYNAERVYPILEETPSHSGDIVDGDAFRLKSSQKILKSIENDALHYKSTRKKYTKSRNFVIRVGAATGFLSVVFSASGLGTGLTGVGLPVGASLGAIGGLCGIVSVGCGMAIKSLSKKVSKHEENVTRAKSSINTLRGILSKALTNGKIDEKEYALVLNENNIYNGHMLDVRKREEVVDLKKTREEVRSELLSKLSIPVDQ